MKRRWTRSEWTATASDTATRGILRALDCGATGWLYRDEAIDALRALDAHDVPRGDHRAIIVAAQSLLPGPADIDDVIRVLGSDALIWRWRPGGALAHLEELRDLWTVPSLRAVCWACDELRRQAQLRHIDRLTRSARCGEDVTRLLGAIVSMNMGVG